ncbi:MAG: hypothetical protein A2015_13725 [Spirochaetes bacterium GWF1_31_7]|nr:MAG: hypothetical protein A2Y30_11100 [Spirochaetes bacterium GWE1_32_154]OHD47704.1 MAG: hypothetical protein A2Y29_05070 [Spirochaetes bacterium GWE2_31_10]OHD49877.1 MAG: hypothetical protein A2015_13725 [Spirochaetes bacterium GWF1_31_7]OHD72840.1 MAG: hypothetical protein A2355_17835 [Spirochaetes bacterium RIFOXYB1_FULL_32_8]HBD96294.1 hypothetical protein [Spirochaetia bacterium]
MRFLMCFLLTIVSFTLYSNDTVLFFEDFNNLDSWKSIKLPLAKNPSQYSIITDNDQHYLKAYSKNAASSLQSQVVFNVYQYPVVKWRWKIDRVLDKGDVTKKNGDDYPIRIYINFVYKKEMNHPGFAFKHNFVKATYGLEIPRYSLNYIIESKNQKKVFYDNPFDPDDSKIIIKRSSQESVSIWFDESINIVEDFKKAFGFDPPLEAYVAIMCDTDNTGEEVSAYIDYVGVYKE